MSLWGVWMTEWRAEIKIIVEHNTDFYVQLSACLSCNTLTTLTCLH